MKSHQLPTALALLALLTHPISAVPNVTVIPLLQGPNTGCSAWPGWIPTRDADTTGNLLFEVTGADDEAVNGLLTTTHTTPWPTVANLSNTINNVFVDLRKSRRIAKPVYRCWNGEMRLGPSLDEVISVHKDWRNAFLTVGEFDGGPGYKLEPYAHEINGVRQEGVFLGAQGKTTWGFRWSAPQWADSDNCGADINGRLPLDWYEVKLVGLEYDNGTESRGASPSEFEGFIKAVEW